MSILSIIIKKFKIMKILLKLLSLVTCVILAAGCATVKENENAEEKESDRNVISVEDYGTFKKITKFDDLGDTIWTYKGDLTAITNHIFGPDNLSLGKITTIRINGANENCKKFVSVFPNPTSNFVTLDFDYWKYYGEPQNAAPIYFRYSLIFDQKIIYKEDDISNYKAQIVIPEHLLQKEGVYVIAYEFYNEKFSNCQNTISFMVVKTR